MQVASHPAPPDRAQTVPTAPFSEAALRVELIAALDHELRTGLTTILGALQTMARPELTPTDPDLAALLSAALAQAQKMRRLLDELPAASSPADDRPILPAELPLLIREASGAGTSDGDGVSVEVAADLSPVRLSAPGLRRTLAGILQRGCLGTGARVKVEGNRGDCRITITAGANKPPTVPHSTAQLLATMGCLIEEAAEADAPALRLTFPGACREGPG
jgi:signal transduction histidine kinase